MKKPYIFAAVGLAAAALSYIAWNKWRNTPPPLDVKFKKGEDDEYGYSAVDDKFTFNWDNKPYTYFRYGQEKKLSVKYRNTSWDLIISTDRQGKVTFAFVNDKGKRKIVYEN